MRRRIDVYDAATAAAGHLSHFRFRHDVENMASRDAADTFHSRNWLPLRWHDVGDAG